jgi:hypothetical protein
MASYRQDVFPRIRHQIGPDMSGCLMDDGRGPCGAYNEIRDALQAMVNLFGSPHKEEYVDGGATYKLACDTVAKAKAALEQ